MPNWSLKVVFKPHIPYDRLPHFSQFRWRGILAVDDKSGLMICRDKKDCGFFLFGVDDWLNRQ